MDDRESFQFELILEKLDELYERSTRALARRGLTERDFQLESTRELEWRSSADPRERLYVRGLIVQLSRVRMIRNKLQRHHYLDALRHAVDTLVTSEIVLDAESGANLREVNAARAKAPKGSAGIFQALVEMLSSAEHSELSTPIAQEIWANLARYEEFSPREVKVGQETFLVYRDEDRLWQVCESTGREKSISFSTFQNYLTEARKALLAESE